MNFKHWLIIEEQYKPYVTDIAVLFPVVHNQEVIEQGGLIKMKELASKSYKIYFEGDEPEKEVAEFITKYQLSNLETESLEVKNPKFIDAKKFKQGGLLTSIFGGNDPAKKAEMIVTHPFVTELKIIPNILNALVLASKQLTKDIRSDKKLFATVNGISKEYPDGWNDYSNREVSEQEITDLINHANEEHMTEFRNLLNSPATMQNLTRFIHLGRDDGFNKPTDDQKYQSNLANLQRNQNYERDWHLATLLLEKGGIFFIGSDHVKNVENIIIKRQQSN